MTKIFHTNGRHIHDEKLVLEAAAILREGGLVAFPTETVYGLGANGFDDAAVAKIFLAKGRPSDNPIILHICNEEMLKGIVKEIPPKAIQLMKKYWPGPLTLIFKKASCIPSNVTGGLDTVAVRMPSNKIAQRLIQEAGVPVAAPSANLSGKPSPTKSEHVIEDLHDKVDVIIASENSALGLESTVIDLTNAEPVLLRPGYITLEQLNDVVGQVKVDPSLFFQLEQSKVRSPGMKYKHYSPQAPLKVVQGAMEDVVSEINRLTELFQHQGKVIGIIATEQTKDRYHGDIVLSLGDRNTPHQIMHNLFDVLREFNQYPVDAIFSEGFSRNGVELAITNRLVKAAGYDILEV
ncbi:MAG: L-threonylcarbamoyladenylate synthase [Eubacteriales bacterium]